MQLGEGNAMSGIIEILICLFNPVVIRQLLVVADCGPCSFPPNTVTVVQICHFNIS